MGQSPSPDHGIIFSSFESDSNTSPEVLEAPAGRIVAISESQLLAAPSPRQKGSSGRHPSAENDSTSYPVYALGPIRLLRVTRVADKRLKFCENTHYEPHFCSSQGLLHGKKREGTGRNLGW